MFKIKSYQLALTIVGGLSKPSKMPCYGYSIPAATCKTGGKLRKKEGTVCSRCYAHKGNYLYPNVQKAQQKRLTAISDPQWVDAMVRLIYGEDHFRWHDSGDIQDISHLLKIVAIARSLPDTSFWLPTKERGIVNRYLKIYGSFPDNLIVRLSAPMIDTLPRAMPSGVYGSAVAKDKALAGFACKAPSHGGRCGHCRACWDSRIQTIVYKYH
jgi:hypothetical protein